MEKKNSRLFISENIILPEIYNKDKIVNELININKIIFENLWNDKISLKIISYKTGKSFITPNLDTIFQNMDFNTSFAKEIIQVKLNY
jgi:hypothetical protein